MNSDSPEVTLQEPPSEAFLQAILDGIGEGFYAVDSQWRIILFNNEAGLHFRCAPASVIGKVLWDAFPGTKDTVLGHLFLETMRTRKPVSSEAASVVFHDSFLAFRLFPLGDGMGVVFREIAPLKKAEHHRDTLMNELNHRVKNLLATVQTMARQTFREAGLSAAQQASFDLRISTLSNVNQILLREQWKSADINEVILSTLRPHFEALRFPAALSKFSPKPQKLWLWRFTSFARTRQSMELY